MYERMTSDGYFIVTAIHRNDVIDMIGEENTAKLTDADMCRIAKDMQEGYIGSGNYWDQLMSCARDILGDEYDDEWDAEDDER